MTVTIAWVRKSDRADQLLMVSDSRISGGELFYAWPKIVCLNGKFAIAFADDSQHAFPMMQQLALAMESHRPSQLGFLTISEIRTHALKIFAEMAKLMPPSPYMHPPQETIPKASFIIGGYDWSKKKYEIWSINYRKKIATFVASPASWLGFDPEHKRIFVGSRGRFEGTPSSSQILFGGDQASVAKDELLKRLNEKFRGKRFEV